MFLKYRNNLNMSQREYGFGYVNRNELPSGRARQRAFVVFIINILDQYEREIA
jgi:hypothetical protein